MDDATAPRSSGTDFIRQIVAAHLGEGRYASPVTRFPPEPNGYLHIGHVKSNCLNFGIAQEFGGRCHLRFDDTNPETEEVEYVESIKDDVRWLGFDWGEHLYFASDYFERMYECAEILVQKGLAYVDDASEEEISESRGTVTRPGTPTRGRSRGVEENLDLFRRMRAGEFPDGSKVLRAKIDLASPNMIMRDPVLYRIRHAHHYRRGDTWCIYPLYDYAHCLEDAFEGVTHSICTLEFENNREIYDWLLDHIGFEEPRTHQYEFARLELEYTVLSKRKFIRLVKDGHVAGWDDPRMPTVAGLRRRGVPPEALRYFADLIGVAKTNSRVDIGKLDHAIRDALNPVAPRVMAVLEPLRVVLTNWPEDRIEELDAPYFPHDVCGKALARCRSPGTSGSSAPTSPRIRPRASAGSCRAGRCGSATRM
jgi:glutaminyl-tRNA synthetase